MRVLVPMHDFVQPVPDSTADAPDPEMWGMFEAHFCGRCGGHKRDHPLEITEDS
jgi:hypothetical protein